MDTLTKQKLIDTRDFLVELLISKTISTYSLVDNVKVSRVVRDGFITWHDGIELTKQGHAFINEHKDLV